MMTLFRHLLREVVVVEMKILSLRIHLPQIKILGVVLQTHQIPHISRWAITYNLIKSVVDISCMLAT